MPDQFEATPQTSGGLLVAVAADGIGEFEALLRESGFQEDRARPFGVLKPLSGQGLISVV